jgi:hypothetical protein
MPTTLATARHRHRAGWLAAMAALALAACAPCVDTTLRFDTAVVVGAAGRVAQVPADRPTGGVLVRPVEGGPAFFVPAASYPAAGACRAWTPGAPDAGQPAPAPCPEVERDLAPGTFLLVG